MASQSMSQQELLFVIGIVSAIITGLAVAGFFAFAAWSRKEALRRQRDIEVARSLEDRGEGD